MDIAALGDGFDVGRPAGLLAGPETGSTEGLPVGEATPWVAVGEAFGRADEGLPVGTADDEDTSVGAGVAD